MLVPAMTMLERDVIRNFSASPVAKQVQVAWGGKFRTFSHCVSSPQ